MNSTTRWDLSQFTDDPDELPERKRELAERVLAMALVWYMPRKGLDETLQILNDTFNFYSYEPTLLITEPSDPFSASFLTQADPPWIYITEP